MAYHSTMTGLNIHVPHTWTYEDATEREAATGFVSGDIGKIAYQEDDSTFWALTSTSPAWTQFGGATDGDAIHDNVTGEINAITEKTVPVSDDVFVIEDSADSYAKKKIKYSNLSENISVTSDHVTNPVIGTPTYETTKDYCDITQSAGVISGGVISDGGSGTINISALNGVVKTTNSIIGENRFFDLSAVTGQTLTDNSINYVSVDYNSGSPQFVYNTSNTANGHTIFNLGKVYKEGTSIDIINSGVQIQDLVKRIQQHHLEENSLHFVSGAVVSETGTRNIALTSGVMYAGLNRILTDAIDTSVADTFEYYYYTGAAWTESDETQIDNLQYNNPASGLATLSNNRYGVHWVYKGNGTFTYVIYGQDSYTLSGAQTAQVPASLPDHVSEMGVLRAKIIIEKSDTVFTEIESVTDTSFSSSTPSNHNELSGIQGGTADEYYHLTATEHPYVSGANSQSVLTTASPSFAGLTVDTDTLYVDSTNNRVGILTASPGYTLDVDGYVGMDRLVFRDDANTYITQGGTDTINMIVGGNTTLMLTEGTEDYVRVGSGSNGIDFRAGNDRFIIEGTSGDVSVDTDTLFVDASAGRVGIGTTTPDYPLHVVGNVFNTGTKVQSTAPSVWLDETETGNFGGSLVLDGKVLQLQRRTQGFGGFLANPLGVSIEADSKTFWINSSSNVGIGTDTPATSAKLEISSTTGALLLPRMTTTQRDALTAVNGMIIYNSTTNKIEGYESGSWVDI